jgi:hypothetical protein
MGSKSAPKAPDYEAAARQQAEASREVTEQQTWANRPDQYTPWGSTTWQNQQVWDPSTQQYLNRWAQETNLDPTLQAALDEQFQLQLDRSRLAGDLTGRMQNEFGQAMDWSGIRQGGGDVGPTGTQRELSTAGLPDLNPASRYYQQAGDAAYNQWAERALPAQQMAQDQLRTQLYNQGLQEGDAAYDREMAKLRTTQGDQQRQAAFDATKLAGSEAQRYLGMDSATRQQLFGERGQQGQFYNQGGQQDFNQQMASSQYATQQRQQQIAETLQQRGWSLNEINALLSGQQVGMPSMPNFSQAQRSEGYQGLQAAQMTGQAQLDRFNAQQAAMQGMMSGVADLGKSFMPI